MSEQSHPASGDALAAVQRMIEAEYSGALGESRRASATVAQRFSRAYSTAASNLLEKAVIRLGRGDEQAARAFVARALDLPYNEHEEAVPALWEAHMILFTAFSDDVEESEQGDLGWLDRVESVVRSSEEAVQRELRSCLVALFDMDLSNKEQRRLRALVAPRAMTNHSRVSPIGKNGSTSSSACSRPCFGTPTWWTRRAARSTEYCCPTQPTAVLPRWKRLEAAATARPP